MIQSLRHALSLLGLLALTAGAAHAQGTSPNGSAPKESKEAREAREAAEAMERARRLAANPMRVILEASRVRRRADAEPAAASPLLPVSASAGTAAAAVAAEPAPRALPAPAREAAAAEAAQPVISSDLAQARVVGDGAPALDAAALPKPLAPPSMALPALTTLLPEIVRPTLVSRVDPDLPPRLLIDLPPNSVVTVDLLIRADGSVAQVALVTPGPSVRALSRYILPALQQWRFEPLPGERPWRIDLVLNAE